MTEPLDRELSMRAIVGFAVGLVIVILLAGAATWALAQSLRSRSEAGDAPPPRLREARQPHAPPGPRLQTAPFQDLAELRAAEEELLEGWAWIDESVGLARVPVARAMELYAEGLRPGASSAAEAGVPEAGVPEAGVPEAVTPAAAQETTQEPGG
jgi:hypothetical protein